jgi:hypothetical protein
VRIHSKSTAVPHYLAVLSALHRTERPRNYLEIGVWEGDSLRRARRRTFCVGVDPNPRAPAKIEKRCHIERTTSDEFFVSSRVKKLFGGAPIDMAFIDGMHLFEYALRDFMNIERHADKHTLVVVHDLLPNNSEAASREFPGAGKWWMGDVWKLLLVLDDHRPDLELCLLNAHPSGLGLIRRLDASSDIIPRQYEALVTKYVDLTFVDWEDRRRELVPRLLQSPESQRWHKQLDRRIALSDRRIALDPWLNRARHSVRSVRRLAARILRARG